MIPYRDSRLVRAALGAFFLIVAGYGYFEAQGMLFGPSIAVSPEAEPAREPLVSIEGEADHIASFAMNGKAIPVTESGRFQEPYLLAPGYNRIVLDAWDKYGRRRERTIEVVYAPSASSSAADAATSTRIATSSASR